MDRKVELGTVISPAKTIRCGKETYPVLSMTMHNGLVFQDEKFKKVIASKDTSDYKVVYRNQLVISFPIDEGVLAAQRITDAGIVSPAYGIWNIDQTQVLPEFLEYALRCDRAIQYYKAKLRGSTARRRSLPTPTLLAFTIPMPTIEEQIKVLDIIHKLNLIIENRKNQIVQYDNLIKARFVELFGNPELNEKGWKTCRLGDKCKVINGRAYKAEELLDEGKYRVLRVGNFFTNDSWYYSDLELDNDKYCEEGDLLFAWSASFGPRIWHGEKVVYHYHIWKLVGYEAYFNKDFFVELLNYNCDVMKRGTHGSTMLHFTKTQMENQKLIVPPIELQNQFAEFVNRVDKSKVVLEL